MSRVTLDPQFPPTAIQAEHPLGKLIHAGATTLTEIGIITPGQFADPLPLGLLSPEGVHPVTPPREAVQ